MAEFHHFGYGIITPAAAYVLSTLGCILGFLIAKKARSELGVRRGRLLAYASVALGAAGVWLPHVIGLLGITMPDTVVRYDALALATSLAVAVLNIGTGLFIAGFGRRTWWRASIAALIIALGITATELVAMSALRINGMVAMDRTMVAAKAALAVVVAAAALWCASRLRHLWATIVAGMLIGAVLTGLHYLSESGMSVEPMMSGTGPAGVTAMTVLIPVVLLGAVAIVMLAYFSIGNSTMHELHSIYRPGETLEPDLVREVTARIAGGAAVDPQRAAVADPGTGSRRRRQSVAPRPIRPRPTPGTMPTWQSMPVWGTGEPDTEVIPAHVTNARDLRRRHHPGAGSDGTQSGAATQWGAPGQLSATSTLPEVEDGRHPAPAGPASPAAAPTDPSRDARRRNQRR